MQFACLFFAIGVLSAAACPAARAAPPVAGWAPATKWNVAYQPNQCLAGRIYSTGKWRTSLGFEARPLSKNVRVLIKVQRNSTEIIHGIKGSADFAGHEEPLEFITSTPGGDLTTLYTFAADRGLVDKLAPGGLFKFKVPRLALELPVSESGLVMKAMDECVADLLASWGFSVEAQQRLASPPVPEPGRRLFHAEDYPETAMNNGRVGEAQVLIFVRADGSLADCTVAVSSGHKEIDEATCKSVLKRAKFQPALDKAGKAMDAPYLLTVNWQMWG